MTPTDLLSLLLGAAVRACLLALVASTVLICVRSASSSARHGVWTMVLVGMLLEIPLGLLAPEMPLEALPARPVSSQLRVLEPARVLLTMPEFSSLTRQARTDPQRPRFPVEISLVGAYLAISLFLVVRMALGWWTLQRILRNATPIPRLGTGIYESPAFVVPGSTGFLKARIILPEAWSEWVPGKLQAVLAHERAHIRRNDWLIRIGARINVCVFWFHPLAWWMERELARLAEEACDDAALCETADKEEYAVALLDIALAAAAKRSRLDWHVTRMASDSNAARRVNRILDPDFRVPRPISRLSSVALVACSVPVIYLSAAVKLAPNSVDRTESTRAASSPHSVRTMDTSPLQEEGSPALTTEGQTKQWAGRSPHEKSDGPIAICILLDNSGSMRDKRAGLEAAAFALVRSFSSRDDVCVIHFDDEVFSGLSSGKQFSRDEAELEEAVTRADSRGGSAMRDAVQTALHQLQQSVRHDQNALVLITDGGDTSSMVTQAQLLDNVRTSGVRVFSVGLVTGEDPVQTAAARRELEALAAASGGGAYYPIGLPEVQDASSRISNEIRNR